MAPSPEVNEQWLAVASEASTTSSHWYINFAGILTRVKVVCDTGMYRGSKVLTSLRNERDSIIQIG